MRSQDTGDLDTNRPGPLSWLYHVSSLGLCWLPWVENWLVFSNGISLDAQTTLKSRPHAQQQTANMNLICLQGVFVLSCFFFFFFVLWCFVWAFPPFCLYIIASNFTFMGILCANMCLCVFMCFLCLWLFFFFFFCLFVFSYFSLSLFYLILIYYYYHYYFKCLFVSCILKKRKKGVALGGWESGEGKQ
jgi:hypothetical protein